MLVITLGTQASGSTWVFNVVRALFSASSQAAVSISSDNAMEMLDNIPVQADHIVLKAHALDMRLLRLARFSQAKIVISLRDPRDSVVSQYERFHQPTWLAVTDLTRSISSVAMLPAELTHLLYNYDSGYLERPESVMEIAQYLGLAVRSEQAEAIFERLSLNRVRQDIQARLDKISPEESWVHDPETQWHPDHIGDALIGKWRERLSRRDQVVVTNCLLPFYEAELWKKGRQIAWSSELFKFADARTPRQVEELELQDEDRIVVYGPYLYLPAGRWVAAPMIQPSSRWRAVTVKVDVISIDSGRDIAAEKFVELQRYGFSAVALEFDHHDHFQPVEIRIWSVSGHRGRIRFAGVRLTWLGPVEKTYPLAARIKSEVSQVIDYTSG